MNVTGSQRCLKIALTPVEAVTSRDERLVIVPILTSSTLANFSQVLDVLQPENILPVIPGSVISNEREIYTKMLRNLSESSEQNSQIHLATPS